MENVIDLTASDKPFGIETAQQPSTEPLIVEAEGTQVSQTPEQQTSPQLSETRYREQTVSESRAAAQAVMVISAICGAAAGVLLVLTGAMDKEAAAVLSERISLSFGEIFLHRALSGCAILLAEFLLGFFAFGDFFSWICPVFAGMGGGLFIAALKQPVFLPSELAVLLAVIFAGANSALFSRRLLSLASGTSPHLRGMSAAEYSARFALFLLTIVAAAAYEGIAAVNFI